MQGPLRLLVYDETCRGRGALPGLTHSWIVGGALYRALGRLDAVKGVRSWAEALDWLCSVEPERSIAEVQYWGHGKWGCAFVDKDVLDERALLRGHPLFDKLARLAERVVSEDALLWFRTCETFGATGGLSFARTMTDFFGCRAAGHTYIIGPWQSGLHSLRPGETPRWSAHEGLVEGTPDEPRRALWSGAREPNTITCLHGAVPAGF